jgi:hypothetical protein
VRLCPAVQVRSKCTPVDVPSVATRPICELVVLLGLSRLICLHCFWAIFVMLLMSAGAAWTGVRNDPSQKNPLDVDVFFSSFSGSLFVRCLSEAVQIRFYSAHLVILRRSSNHSYGPRGRNTSAGLNGERALRRTTTNSFEAFELYSNDMIHLEIRRALSKSATRRNSFCTAWDPC